MISSRVPPGATFLVGGARSGKSALAVEIAGAAAAGVTFVATGTASDTDMAARIERHRAERPPWPTVEAPLELVEAVTAADPGHLVVVDCLTLWVANLMARGDDDQAIDAEARRFAACLATRPGPVVIVSNEVGLGIHPANELGRRYRDALGRVNRIVAAAADRTLFLAAGRAITLEDPWQLLDP